ncbi:MAG: hypothetical protein GXP35_18745 [Actinobacteria bacterium]|nr:hypothetical protein [Actinomycetota bacterium]
MATDPSPDIELIDLSGYSAPLGVRLSMFNMLSVVIDPYTHQSGWIIPTAARLFWHYQEADIRCGFIVASDADGARSYLDSYVDAHQVLLDPDRELISSMELQSLPALVHIRQDASLAACAEGWDAADWRVVLDGVEEAMDWRSKPALPITGDPGSFAGTPALG